MSNRLKHCYETDRGNGEELVILVDNSDLKLQYYDQVYKVPQGDRPDEDFHPITIYVKEVDPSTNDDSKTISSPTGLVKSTDSADANSKFASTFLVYVDEEGNETDPSKRERRNTTVKVTSGTKFETDQPDQ